MDIRKITDDYSVSPQIDVADVKAIAAAGFKSIMCNRPDHEEPGQPEHEPIAEAARKEGLEVVWVPVIGGAMGPAELEGIEAALRDMPLPMLAYCRTGTRCTNLWAFASHGKVADDEIIERAAQAGYDVRGLIGQMSGR